MDNNICAFIAVLFLSVVALFEFMAICNVSDRIDNLRVRVVVLETKMDMMDKGCRW